MARPCLLGLCPFLVWPWDGELGSPGSRTQLPVQAPGLPVRSPGFTYTFVSLLVRGRVGDTDGGASRTTTWSGDSSRPG